MHSVLSSKEKERERLIKQNAEKERQQFFCEVHSIMREALLFMLLSNEHPYPYTVRLMAPRCYINAKSTLVHEREREREREREGEVGKTKCRERERQQFFCEVHSHCIALQQEALEGWGDSQKSTLMLFTMKTAGVPDLFY